MQKFCRRAISKKGSATIVDAKNCHLSIEMIVGKLLATPSEKIACHSQIENRSFFTVGVTD